MTSFDEGAERICSHVSDMITEYDGRYGLVAWYANDRRFYYCASANLGYGPDFIPELETVFTKKACQIHNKVIHALYAKVANIIYGHGHSSTGTKDYQGWWNKKRAISAIINGMRRKGTDLPLLVLVGGKNNSVVFSNPVEDPDMSALGQRLMAKFSSMDIAPNRFKPGQALRNRLQTNTSTEFILMRKRRRAWSDSGSNVRRRNEYVGVDVVHHSGTVSWYSNQLRSPKVPGPHAVMKTDEKMQWALLDARVSGDKMVVHHNMFVEVSVTRDELQRASCTCEVFLNCYNKPSCVHVQYVKRNLEELSLMRFPESGEVVDICSHNGEICAYYLDGCFVRSQGHKGYRCDKDLTYSCLHVEKVCEERNLPMGWMAARDFEQASDQDDSEMDAEFELTAQGDDALASLGVGSIEYPYTDKMADAVRRIAKQGFGPDSGNPCLWFGDVLKPEIPQSRCSCGEVYREDGYIVFNECTVYLSAPHCARRLPCLALRCPNRKERCLQHYTGLEHGLIRIGTCQVVELDLLVNCALNMVNFGGVSLTALCENFHEKYEFYREPDLRIAQDKFLDVNTFRSAVYKVGKSLQICHPVIEEPSHVMGTAESCPPNPMICPICKDHPEVIIMDGTSITIRADSFKGKSMTSPSSNSVKKRPHEMLNRCVLNVTKNGRSRSARKQLINLLKRFENWIDHSQAEGGHFDQLQDLLKLADAWEMGRFLAWLHQECCKQISKTNRKAFKAVLRAICSHSPVTAYVSYRQALKLNSYAEADFQPIPREALTGLGPTLSDLLDSTRIGSANEVPFPKDWHPFLRELVNRVFSIHKQEFDGGDFGLGPSIHHPSQPSVMDEECLRSGVCCGLRKIRERPTYACDNDLRESKQLEEDKASCRHNFNKPGARTGGVFSCLCSHGICYASFIIKDAEGRNEPFTFMTCYLREAPKIVVYDFACSLMDYCLNRAPNFFKDTKFLVDKFHWFNHTACARTFNIRDHGELASQVRNSEACEQINSAMKRLKFVLSRMGQEPFMLFLRLFASRWNRKKIENILDKQRRADLASTIEHAVEQQANLQVAPAEDHSAMNNMQH